MPKPASNGPLFGQVAAVTGAGRGIGAAIATRLAELGARMNLKPSRPFGKLSEALSGAENGHINCHPERNRMIERSENMRWSRRTPALHGATATRQGIRPVLQVPRELPAAARLTQME